MEGLIEAREVNRNKPKKKPQLEWVEGRGGGFP